MLLSPRFYSPSQVADTLGTTVEAVRQAVLNFDGEPGRIELYCEIKTSMRALWLPAPDLDDGRQYPRRHEVRNVEKHGEAYYLDVTDGAPVRVGGEASLGPGLWLEIDPHDGHTIAANPEQAHTVNWLRAPNEQLGKMPANAIVSLELEKEARPVIRFDECWIARASVERMQLDSEAPIADMVEDRLRLLRRAWRKHWPNADAKDRDARPARSLVVATLMDWKFGAEDGRARKGLCEAGAAILEPPPPQGRPRDE